MTKKEWKIGDVGYFFYTYLWQTMKATVTMTTNDYLVVTDEFGYIHRVGKEDFYKTEEEVELSL